MIRNLTSSAVLSVLLFGAAAYADDTATPDQAQKIDILNQAAANSTRFSFDYGIPESPALMLAGLAGDKIKPATSLKPFVLSLPSLIDGTGAGTAALDASPLWLFNTNSAAFDYTGPDHYLDRVLSRTRIGAAVFRGDDGGGDATKAKPSRLAFSVSLGLSDGSDPLTAGSQTGLLVGDGGAKDQTAWNKCLTNSQVTLGAYVPGSPMHKIIETAEGNLDGQLPDKAMNDPGRMQTMRDTVQQVEADYYMRQGMSGSQAVQQVNQRATAYPDTAEQWKKRIADDIGLLETERGKYYDQNAADAHAKARLAALTGCKKSASAAAEHGFDLQFGAGVVWSGTPGKIGGFSHANAALWLAARQPLDQVKGDDCTAKDARSPATMLLSCWTIGGSGRFSFGEIDATGNVTTPEFEADVAEGWIGLERLSASSKIGGYFGYIDQRAVKSADSAFSRHGMRWLVSGAVSLDRLMEGVWLVGSYGAAEGSVTTLDDKVVMLTLTFAPPALGSGFVQKSGG